MATSGTVSAYRYNQQKILDHAFRRAGKAAEMASGENIAIGQDLIFSITSEWINAGYPLWTRQYQLFGPTIGSPEVPCTPGTVDVFHSYWRILQPFRGADTLSTGAGDTTLFSGQPGPDVTIPGPNAGATVNFGSATEIDTIGVLLGGVSTVTAALIMQASSDNATWVTVATFPTTTYSPGQWQYFDLDPTVSQQYLRIVYPGSSSITLNQLQFALSQGQDILLGELNQDMYYNLPDKQMRGSQPNSAFIDRQIVPVLKIWPTCNVQAFYNGCITMLTRRYIQDPGALTDNIEVPQRWIEALQWRLANVLMVEIPDNQGQGQQSILSIQAKAQRMAKIEKEAAKSESLMWAEERTRGPMQLTPMIGVYTR